MYKLFEFIRSIYVVLLFVVLEVLAVSYYARSTHYTQARLLAQSGQVVGSVRGFFAGIGHYFTLGRENEILLRRVAELEERLVNREACGPVHGTDSVRMNSSRTDSVLSPFRTMTAHVIANSINRDRNFIMLDRGRRDGVVEQMALLSPDGAMVGYVIDCSARHAVAVSVLNTAFRASGKLVGSDYFGSVYWDGMDQHVVVLDEVSKYADPQPGQQVISTGFSLYFPENVMIGTVESAELNETRTAYVVRVRLAAEISRLSNVILVENRNMSEMQDLQQSDKVKQFTRQ